MLEGRLLECVRGEHRLFADLSFQLQAGEALHLQGRNGAGKTSLLRILCGLAQPAAGDVRWRGESVRHLGDAFRAELFYLGHLNAIKEEFTPIENLRVAARLTDRHLDDNRILDVLEQIGLGGREDLPCRHLSQGQKRRVALASLMVDERPLWILDEPYVALDVAAVDLVARRIGAHLARGGLVVLTTHQDVALPAGQTRTLLLS